MRRDSTAKKIKGCTAENFAVYHFQKEGYYVFKACQTNGPIDLIVVNPGNFRSIYYDIKTRRYRKDGTRIHSSPRTKKGNIRVVYFEKGAIIESQKKSNCKRIVARQTVHEKSLSKQKRKKTIRESFKKNG